MNTIAPKIDIFQRDVTREQVEDAIRTLLVWVGENPAREGLSDTPKRVATAFKEYCAGYEEDPRDVLDRTFEEITGYRDMVVLRQVPFESMCEHHLAPIIGNAHVAYLPVGRVVGISKLARVVDGYSRRLQIQERLTVEIAEAVDNVLKPRGAACVIDAEHFCMKCRGVRKKGSRMTTSHLTGAFLTDDRTRQEFYQRIRCDGFGSRGL
ncbi:GTP cyclohydrolase I FolE [Rhizobium brockwellii]|uniref:GTP cyclohydrolase I FolE n=2 Tax=Rhizobium brockwellii TaxID=3019932 RepID=UPI003F9D4EAB